MRADAVGCYGAGPGRTPALDALAARGTRFEEAMAAASWTLPSHASIFTGLLPTHHGVWDAPPRHLARALGPEHTTLAERLRAAGYLTLATTGGGYVAAHFGFSRGFDRYLAAVPAVTTTDLGAIRGSLGGLLDGARQPFFLFAHTFAAHSPYGGDPLPDQEPLRRDAALARAAYAGGVRAADSLVGDVVGALAARGLEQRTVVVVLSDHGEEFADHDPAVVYGGHGHSVYEELVRVPLVLAGPGVAQGARVSGPVSLCDVAPTLLGLLGVGGLPPGDGLDLSALVAAGGAAPGRVVVAEQARAEGSEWKAARGGDLKLIRDAFAPDARIELFDLRVDPAERRPLDAGGAPAALGAALYRLQARPKPPGSPADRHLDPQLEERLRGLGYLQ